MAKRTRTMKRTMAGHCRACGRVLTDADSLTRGYGPECAAKLMRSGAGKGHEGTQAEVAQGYDPERYAKIARALSLCQTMLETAERAYRLALADAWATDDEIAEAKRVVSLRIHWLRRVDAMERRAARLLAPLARVA